MEQSRSTTVRSPRIKTTRALLVAAAVTGAILLMHWVPVDEVLNWLSGRVNDLGVWGPVAFGIVFVVLTLFLVPATPMALAAGAMFGSVVGAATIILGSTVSAGIAYVVTRTVAFRRVSERIHHYPKLDAVYRALGEPGGWKLVIAVRLSHALPFGIQNLLFGVSPIRFIPYLSATVVSMLPGSIVYTYLGHLGADALRSGAVEPTSAGDWTFRVAGLLVAAVALAYIISLARRIIRDKAHVDLSEHPLAADDEVKPDEAL